MTTRSILTIDPGGVARERGADGEGIVVATLGTGIDGRHPHFARHANLVLPPPLHHYDLTLLRNRRDDLWASFTLEGEPTDDTFTMLGKLDGELHDKEALFDPNGHSTHAAAIIAGYVEAKDAGVQWDLGDARSMTGVAPKCKLLSLKVLDDEGRGDEFDVLRALHIVRAVNARARKIAVHAVFVPLSLPHDVRNFACGHTPVCEAVDRLVESGIVVVAPSGNLGYMSLSTPEGSRASLMTITDPGNAERAITVGATHSSRPKDYGASYFSGRGPTLDGRDKPDLLAPGERILSAFPASEPPPVKRKVAGKKAVPKRRTARYEQRDGTTMAAAHVAGAVAALLSARPDLIGQPDAVKELLRSTATDLGRAAWVQGCGLLNLSRALGDTAAVESPRAAEEEDRQAAPTSPAPIVLPDTQSPAAPAPARANAKPIAVAVSFPGEHREYVEQVVYALRNSGVKRDDVFYDRFREAELSRPNLDLYLLDIYGKQSELVVVFLGGDYARKEWCRGLEWRAVRELIKTMNEHVVMPVRLDEAHVPGLLSIDGYVSAVNRDPEQIASLIMQRLRANRKGKLG